MRRCARPCAELNSLTLSARASYRNECPSEEAPPSRYITCMSGGESNGKHGNIEVGRCRLTL